MSKKDLSALQKNFLKVTLIKSAIRKQTYQSDCLRGLGLRKLHHSRVLEDTPSVRGMINKVDHLVQVEPQA